MTPELAFQMMQHVGEEHEADKEAQREAQRERDVGWRPRDDFLHSCSVSLTVQSLGTGATGMVTEELWPCESRAGMALMREHGHPARVLVPEKIYG